MALLRSRYEEELQEIEDFIRHLWTYRCQEKMDREEHTDVSSVPRHHRGCLQSALADAAKTFSLTRIPLPVAAYQSTASTPSLAATTRAPPADVMLPLPKERASPHYATDDLQYCSGRGIKGGSCDVPTQQTKPSGASDISNDEGDVQRGVVRQALPVTSSTRPISTPFGPLTRQSNEPCYCCREMGHIACAPYCPAPQHHRASQPENYSRVAPQGDCHPANHQEL